jgi:hypothetical protein
MTPEDIKEAANKLADRERIPLITKEIQGTNPITITCGDKTVNVPSSGGYYIRRAVVEYLESIAEDIDIDLDRLGVLFDTELDALVKDAAPTERTDA